MDARRYKYGRQWKKLRSDQMLQDKADVSVSEKKKPLTSRGEPKKKRGKRAHDGDVLQEQDDGTSLVSASETSSNVAAASSSKGEQSHPKMDGQPAQTLIFSSRPDKPTKPRKKAKRTLIAQEHHLGKTDESPPSVECPACLQHDVLQVGINDAARAEIEALKEQNARLQKELSLKEGVVDRQRETISYVYGQCTCTVCMELVWRPHVLSPCGHIFCARCLVAWFTKPTSDERPLPMHSDLDVRDSERRRNHRRTKVCPHCRERVAVPPVEVWLVKGLVDRIDKSMRDGQGSDEHLVKGKDGFADLSIAAIDAAKGAHLPASKAIWEDIFAQEKGRDEPMYDEEDRVYRCIFCANEVVNGACQGPNCGMLYNIGSLGSGLELDHEGVLLGEDHSASLGSEIGYDSYDEEEFDEEEEDFDFIDDDGAIEVLDSSDSEYDSECGELVRQEYEGENDFWDGRDDVEGERLYSDENEIDLEHDDDEDDDSVLEVTPPQTISSRRRARRIEINSDDDDVDVPHLAQSGQGYPQESEVLSSDEEGSYHDSEDYQ